MIETTDAPNRFVTPEMQTRIDKGKLDYRRGVGWHDPRGFSKEQNRRDKLARSFTTR